MKLIRQDHIELVGDGYVLLTAPHASETEADLYTGHIVEDAALTARCCAIVGKMSRDYLDPSRVKAAQTEFERSVASMTVENGIRCLLDILGKREPGVDIMASNGQTANSSITDLVKTRLSKDFVINVDPQYLAAKSGNTITDSREKSTGTSLLDSFHLRFGEHERNYERDKVVTGIAELVALINRHLGFKERSDGR